MEAKRRILVPTDFSETADRALEMAIEMGRALDAVVELVHVSAPVLVLPPPFELVPIPTLFPQLPRRIEEGLETRAARVREAGLSCEIATLDGAPHLEIVREAEDTRAYLIVMGTHGRGGIGHAVLGSVAERVVHRAKCPVLVVPDRKA
jgi:nucleotide-binding universal stress UspA family protein